MAVVREVQSPRAIHRHNLLPMEVITANPAPGVPPAEARTLCSNLAEVVRQELRLATDYQMLWP
jgi:multidrug efflux pump subunit AcrB